MVFYFFIEISIEHSTVENFIRCSILGLRCCPMSYKKDARLIWVNKNFKGLKVKISMCKDNVFLLFVKKTNP